MAGTSLDHIFSGRGVPAQEQPLYVLVVLGNIGILSLLSPRLRNVRNLVEEVQRTDIDI